MFGGCCFLGGFLFARVGIAHEERGKPCRRSTLRLTERENTAPLRFSNSDVPAFSSEVISHFVYSLLNRDLVFFGGGKVFVVVVFFCKPLPVYINSVIPLKCWRRGQRWHLSMRAPRRNIYDGTVTPAEAQPMISQSVFFFSWRLHIGTGCTEHISVKMLCMSGWFAGCQ